jgi:mannose-6-phosphate isomerase-like protein (cupin superfamily)
MDANQPTNLERTAADLPELWSPKVVTRVADQFVKVARIQGEFVWHAHDEQDELFLVLRGTLVIQLRDRDVTLNTGDAFVVPAGIEHRPVANDEVLIALIEPVETLHTGSVESELTRSIEEQVG